jgi:hypothetical protein
VQFGPQVIPTSVVPELDPEPSDSPVTDTLRREFPLGDPVEVFYNPRDPARSVLLRHHEGRRGPTADHR